MHMHIDGNSWSPEATTACQGPLSPVVEAAAGFDASRIGARRLALQVGRSQSHGRSRRGCRRLPEQLLQQLVVCFQRRLQRTQAK